MSELKPELNEEPRYSLTVGDQTYAGCTEQELQDYGCSTEQIKEAKNNYYNVIAFDYITTYYEVWRQLTLGRVGTSAQKTKMYHFIDAVRDWSERDNPTLEQLHAIQP
ncbi:hypothetical protein [Algicola sagamiensis]|uniref:hypothetical protein n=1 Tax=Algicola sagamiensis TaxID=163869 RepID=UPI0003692335|nr:hypothetical protein [Algicola sagamiensis]